jgi:hypothetical protein
MAQRAKQTDRIDARNFNSRRELLQQVSRALKCFEQQGAFSLSEKHLQAVR